MSLTKSTILFASGTLLSRFSGLLRTTIVGAVFGAGPLLDAFLVAFRIPNLFREMLAEGALANSFTKVFSATKAKDEQAAKAFFAHMFYLVVFFTILSSTLGFILAPFFVKLMTSHGQQSSEFIHNTTGLTRILFPFLGLMMLGSIFSGVLHQKGRFFSSALAPAGFNLGFILGAICFAPILKQFGPLWIDNLIAERFVVGLAIGVLLGGVLQTILYGWHIYRYWIKPSWHYIKSINLSPQIKETFQLMIPASLAASTGPINLVINTNFATSLQEGTVSWLDFSFRLLQLPIGLFGVAVSIAILPTLSTNITDRNNIDQITSKYFQNACLLVLWLILPCWLMILVFHQSIVELLFEYGRFTAKDTLETSKILFVSSFGLVGYALIKVLISFYYATNRTTYALKVALICVAINFIANYLLVPRFDHLGLAATSAIVLSVNALILIFGLFNSGLKIAFGDLFKNLGLLSGCSFLAFLALLIVSKIDFSSVISLSRVDTIIKLILGVSIIFIIFYLPGKKLLISFKRH